MADQWGYYKSNKKKSADPTEGMGEWAKKPASSTPPSSGKPIPPAASVSADEFKRFADTPLEPPPSPPPPAPDDMTFEATGQEYSASKTPVRSADWSRADTAARAAKAALDKLSATNYSADMSGLEDELKNIRGELQTAKKTIKSNEEREQLVNAFTQLAVGLVGLASLKDKNSLGVNVAGFKPNSTDWNEKIKSELADFQLRTQEVRDRIKERQEKAERGFREDAARATTAVGTADMERQIAQGKEMSNYYQAMGDAATVKAGKVTPDKARQAALTKLAELGGKVAQKGGPDNEGIAASARGYGLSLGIPAGEINQMYDKAKGYGSMDDGDVAQFLSMLQERAAQAQAPTAPASDRVRVLIPGKGEGSIPRSQIPLLPPGSKVLD